LKIIVLDLNKIKLDSVLIQTNSIVRFYNGLYNHWFTGFNSDFAFFALFEKISFFVFTFYFFPYKGSCRFDAACGLQPAKALISKYPPVI